jgi:adenosylcobinamide-GDP ribazoletransferase
VKAGRTMDIKEMLRDILTAFRTLTILPVPGKDAENLSLTLCCFPLVGALLGVLVLILYEAAAAASFQHPPVLAILSLAVITWLTGGLHIDGMGDVADAFGGGTTKERVLQILKDPRMGSFGVCAIVFAILTKAWCWQFYFERGNPWIVFWSLVFSRSMQGFIIAFVPNARTDSIAGPFGLRSWFARVSLVVSFVIAGFAAFCLSSLRTAVVSAGFSLAVTVLFALYCWRRIQGITGDCVGATNEIAEISVLVGGMIFQI